MFTAEYIVDRENELANAIDGFVDGSLAKSIGDIAHLQESITIQNFRLKFNDSEVEVAVSPNSAVTRRLFMALRKRGFLAFIGSSPNNNMKHEMRVYWKRDGEILRPAESQLTAELARQGNEWAADYVEGYVDSTLMSRVLEMSGTYDSTDIRTIELNTPRGCINFGIYPGSLVTKKLIEVLESRGFSAEMKIGESRRHYLLVGWGK